MDRTRPVLSANQQLNLSLHPSMGGRETSAYIEIRGNRYNVPDSLCGQTIACRLRRTIGLRLPLNSLR